MQLIADLHLHSKYSRAVSQKMSILEITRWAQKKGIDLVATGDWTHPLWLREIKANLEEDGSGLLRLKGAEVGTNFFSSANRSAMSLSGKPVALSRSLSADSEKIVPSRARGLPAPLFLLSTEISSIYIQGGKQRRIHNLILVPSISVVEKINKELEKRGANLFSDGRPIVGLTCQELVELVLGVDENCFIVPSHIWTPWYSLFGSMSGFDSIDECFGKMGKYIYAIETGLSSSPAMNWRISDLDNRAILSFSDAHSGPKLGREATVFELWQLSYGALAQAIKGLSFSEKSASVSSHQLTSDTRKVRINQKSEFSDLSGIRFKPIKADEAGFSENHIAYTIEFYPEEGKYHYTGHRNCGVRQSPEETKKLGKTCPVCGRPLTVGVMHRVQQLAGREIKNEKLKVKNDENGARWIGYKNRPPYVTLVPLFEILGESLGGLPTSQNIINEYENLTSRFGGEFGVLLKTPIEEITKAAGQKVAEGIKKVRGGNIIVEPGYDGVFGKVKIWKEEEKEEERKKQLSLF